MRKKQIEKIIKRLEKVQSRATARTLSPDHVRDILESVKYKKFFSLYMHGGKVANSYWGKAEATQITVRYDRKTNHFDFSVWRVSAGNCAYGSGEEIDINTTDRWWCISDAKREKLRQYLIAREQRKYPEYRVRRGWRRTPDYTYRLIVKFMGEEYHFTTRKKPYTAKNLKRKIRLGKKEIVKRLKADKKRYEAKRFISDRENLKKVFVSVKDSLNSGNCRAETERFKEKIKKEIGNIGAIRADILLNMREDSYTRRAVEVAAKRYC